MSMTEVFSVSGLRIMLQTMDIMNERVGSVVLTRAEALINSLTATFVLVVCKLTCQYISAKTALWMNTSLRATQTGSSNHSHFVSNSLCFPICPRLFFLFSAIRGSSASLVYNKINLTFQQPVYVRLKDMPPTTCVCVWILHVLLPSNPSPIQPGVSRYML
ncbi:hypothetical protein BaRGS_00012200 [Batillaria attramentaria]|uniref:Uncharacterized protein n=1 Tax=Batillaria attramentaria TaxID=370345 RepID=A0ABD0LBF6_9CAEN